VERPVYEFTEAYAIDVRREFEEALIAVQVAGRYALHLASHRRCITRVLEVVAIVESNPVEGIAGYDFNVVL
jgi:hypothetical protein